jgi:hypothetical protein
MKAHTGRYNGGLNTVRKVSFYSALCTLTTDEITPDPALHDLTIWSNGSEMDTQDETDARGLVTQRPSQGIFNGQKHAPVATDVAAYTYSDPSDLSKIPIPIPILRRRPLQRPVRTRVCRPHCGVLGPRGSRPVCMTQPLMSTPSMRTSYCGIPSDNKSNT